MWRALAINAINQGYKFQFPENPQNKKIKNSISSQSIVHSFQQNRHQSTNSTTNKYRNQEKGGTDWTWNRDGGSCKRWGGSGNSGGGSSVGAGGGGSWSGRSTLRPAPRQPPWTPWTSAGDGDRALTTWERRRRRRCGWLRKRPSTVGWAKKAGDQHYEVCGRYVFGFWLF